MCLRLVYHVRNAGGVTGAVTGANAVIGGTGIGTSSPSMVSCISIKVGGITTAGRFLRATCDGLLKKNRDSVVLGILYDQEIDLKHSSENCV